MKLVVLTALFIMRSVAVSSCRSDTKIGPLPPPPSPLVNGPEESTRILYAHF